jgi:hypothetical protein
VVRLRDHYILHQTLLMDNGTVPPVIREIL